MIPAIVLAAGRSSRMGRSKALLPLAAGETFLSHVVETFRRAEADDIVVVVGHESAAIVADFEQRPWPVRFVVNPRHEEGQLTSIAAGLRAVDRPGVRAALLTLVDVPLVSEATVRAVVARYLATHAPIVRPTRGGAHGHPVLIDRALFDRVCAADPAEGARPVIRAFASPAGDVEVHDEGAFLDIDTLSDYERAIGRLPIG